MSVIKIDGVSYDVGEIELRRGAEIIFDPVTQGVMLDFSETDDAAAVKYSYSFNIEPKRGEFPDFGANNANEQYDAFYYDITSPKSIRTVELPFGQGSIIFGAKIKSAGDMLKKSVGGMNRWGGLTVTFMPVKPQRYA
ncbi:MAG: hypothetical protein FWH10_07210 [Oscillospiraceae bacterium]|nr:hypothetical protein [Oscillospiraceae bacterium]